MSEVENYLHMLRIAPSSDVLVLLSCTGLTVVFDMVVGVSVGIVLAALLFMRRMADTTSTRVLREGHPSRPQNIPPGVLLYEIAGPLFFGAAERAMTVFTTSAGPAYKTAVLDLSSVPVMDVTGLVALERILVELNERGMLVVMAGVKHQPRELMTRAGLIEAAGKLHFRDSIRHAIADLTPAP